MPGQIGVFGGGGVQRLVQLDETSPVAAAANSCALSAKWRYGAATLDARAPGDLSEGEAFLGPFSLTSRSADLRQCPPQVAGATKGVVAVRLEASRESSLDARAMLTMLT